MTSITPFCAREARDLGWHMVCVTPVQQLHPENLLELIFAQFEEVAYFPFTYKDGYPHGDENRPVWVRGFSGTVEAQRVLLAAFFEGSNRQLYRFLREVIAEVVPGVRLTQDSAKKRHSGPSQLLKRRLQESTAS